MGDGGDLKLESGLSEMGSSGIISISSPSANHASGDVSIQSGSSDQGESGKILLETGVTHSKAQGIQLNVGDSSGRKGGGKTMDAPDLLAKASPLFNASHPFPFSFTHYLLQVIFL